MKPALRSLATFTALAIAAVAPDAARAQGAGTGGSAAPADTGAAVVVARVHRASWTSDRIPLRVGDLLTVVVDEQTAARERVSRIATGNRGQDFDLGAVLNDDTQRYNIRTGIQSGSRDVGEANRAGDLTSVLSVRVTAIEPNGLARIEGSKQVTVDGRLQEVTLKGVIRPHDVQGVNAILSSRIAEAVITYKGKKIGPRTGIIGSILGILWP
jgi:flagellar L-ring protein precursor FlgH